MLLFTMSCMLEAYCFEQWFLFLEGVLGNTISLCRILSNFVFRTSSLESRREGGVYRVDCHAEGVAFLHHVCLPLLRSPDICTSASGCDEEPKLRYYFRMSNYTSLRVAFSRYRLLRTSVSSPITNTIRIRLTCEEANARSFFVQVPY